MFHIKLTGYTMAIFSRLCKAFLHLSQAYVYIKKILIYVSKETSVMSFY